MSALDLLVLGGGVTGLGVARMAARAGWSVALIERDDLASGASSASSHMLHGGLRYLEHGQFKLVREALGERLTVSRMAPALARPVRFVAPVRRGDRVPAWKLRAGLALYDVLAGRAALSAHRMLRGSDALALEPGLAREGLYAAGIYSDAVVDDARLALAVGRDAAASGATLHTRTDVLSLRPAEDGLSLEVHVRQRESGAEQRLLARAIVNATGAWCDRTRTELTRMLHPGAADPAPLLRPSRGTHLVYPALTNGHGIVTTASDGRVFFVVPFAGRSLVGTTEVEVSSPPPPEAALPSSDEVAYLAREVARVLPGAAALTPLAVFAGIRPLLAGSGEVGGASREHHVVQDGALFTIAGGKYTTFRLMARDTLAAVARHLGRVAPELPRVDAPLPAPLAEGVTPSDLGAHAAERELARTLADTLRRRSTHWLADDRGLSVARDVAEGMARRLGWTPERVREELDAYEASVRAEHELIARALASH